MTKISNEAYEELRRILEEQYGQSFAVEDVKEIGDGLVDFIILLSEINSKLNHESDFTKEA